MRDNNESWKEFENPFWFPQKAKIESGESSLYHRWALRGDKKEAFDKDAIVFFRSSGEDGTMERVWPSIILIKPRVPRAQEKFVFVGGEKLREKRNVW